MTCRNFVPVFSFLKKLTTLFSLIFYFHFENRNFKPVRENFSNQNEITKMSEFYLFSTFLNIKKIRIFNFQTDNKQSVVTQHDVGKLVNVTGCGKGEQFERMNTLEIWYPLSGILRYVGVIHGKDGLFCGIELINSPGKHDGSYSGKQITPIRFPLHLSSLSGVSYFMCPQGRGIFAPLYKVTIDDAVSKPAQPSPSKITEVSHFLVCVKITTEVFF